MEGHVAEGSRSEPLLRLLPGSLPAGHQTLSLLRSPAGAPGAGVLRQFGKAQKVNSGALAGFSGVSRVSGRSSGWRFVSFLAPHPKSLLDE